MGISRELLGWQALRDGAYQVYHSPQYSNTGPTRTTSGAARALSCVFLLPSGTLLLSLLGLQPRFGGKLPRNQVVCPQNGNAVLNGLSPFGYHAGYNEMAGK